MADGGPRHLRDIGEPETARSSQAVGIVRFPRLETLHRFRGGAMRFLEGAADGQLAPKHGGVADRTAGHHVGYLIAVGRGVDDAACGVARVEFLRNALRIAALEDNDDIRLWIGGLVSVKPPVELCAAELLTRSEKKEAISASLRNSTVINEVKQQPVRALRTLDSLLHRSDGW